MATRGPTSAGGRGEEILKKQLKRNLYYLLLFTTWKLISVHQYSLPRAGILKSSCLNLPY